MKSREVRVVFSSVQTMVRLPECGMLKRAVPTMKESALKVDSGRQIPCRIGDSNPRQYCNLAFQSDAPPTEIYPSTELNHDFQIKTKAFGKRRLFQSTGKFSLLNISQEETVFRSPRPLWTEFPKMCNVETVS